LFLLLVVSNGALQSPPSAIAARNASHLSRPLTFAPFAAVAFSVKVPPAPAGANFTSPDPRGEPPCSVLTVSAAYVLPPRRRSNVNMSPDPFAGRQNVGDTEGIRQRLRGGD